MVPHLNNVQGLGHRVVGLDGGHELDVRLQRVMVQFLGARALRNRQQHLIQQHLQQPKGP